MNLIYKIDKNETNLISDSNKELKRLFDSKELFNFSKNFNLSLVFIEK